MQAFMDETKEFVMGFKNIRRMDRDEYALVLEDWATLEEVIKSFEGTLIERVGQMMTDFKESDEGVEVDKVLGLTVHKAKGLENKVVFILDFNQWPSPYFEDINYREEERIAYVAATRAKEKLYFTSVGDSFYFSHVLEAAPVVKVFIP
jgi:superfamily I DNA/RNA helicase